MQEMRQRFLIVLFLLLPLTVFSQRNEDADKLGMALEYFQSSKYHEALLIFQKLADQYRLNPRYMAFIGVCYYYEWDYPNAIKYLDSSIPQLENFSPHERSFYYWANAESHFNLQKYKESIPLYEQMLKLCYENEKPDAYYRLGFSYMFAEDWYPAAYNYQKALDGYLEHRNVEENKARIAQIRNMLNGCREHTAKPITSEELKKESLKSFSPRETVTLPACLKEKF